MEDLSRFCCLNPDCVEHGKRGGPNVAVRARYGPHRRPNVAVRARYGPHRRRLLYCKACKARFSERKGTPLFACRLGESVARSALAHLQDGCGVRQTERLVGVHRDTVARLGRKAGEHARAAHAELAALSPPHDQAPAR
jgi:transposase-like protein